MSSRGFACSSRIGGAPFAFVLACVMALGAAALPSPAGAATVGTVYGGATAQDDPMALVVTGDHRLVRAVLVHVDLRCADGKSAVWAGPILVRQGRPRAPRPGDNVLFAGAISRTGRVRLRGLGTTDYGSAVGAVRETMGARFRGAAASGTLSMTIGLTDKATAAPVTTCRSGAVRWRAASAPGRVFAGLTGQGRPLVVRLNRSATRVADLHVSWIADCSGGGATDLGDDLTNFPLDPSGRFGDDFTRALDLPGGGRSSFAYRIHGTAGPRRASGTFGVIETDTDAAGATADTCTLAPVRWSAVS
jgi:hypothetical protein